MSGTAPTFAVFVIHSFEDMPLVEKIHDDFKVHSNIQVLVAEWRRRPGDLLADKVTELIQASQVVIVVWSHNLEKSIMGNQEIGYANALNKRIFPFVAKGMSTKGLLQGMEYIEYNPFAVEKDIKILVEEIKTFALHMGYNF